MMYAKNNNGVRITAEPGVVATCPNCGNEVKAKCGDIKIWHFAHISLQDCDTWSEGETEWHREWKEMFPESEREIVIKPHRADIVHKGTVIEFQSKSLDLYSLYDREKFYGKMVWVTKSDETKFSFKLKEKNGRMYFSFRWKWCSETWKNATKQIYVDIGDDFMFKIWKIYDNNYGAGEMLTKQEFLGEF